MPQTPLDRAVADHKAGRFADARAGYALALKFQPRNSQIHRLIGVTFHQQGALDNAIAAFRKAIAMDGGNFEAFRNLGVALREKGDMTGAITALREAIARRPGYAEAWRNLGNALEDTERTDEAEAAFRKAIALKPTYAEAHMNLGTLLDQNKRSEEAITALKEAVRLSPELASARNNLGLALRRSGEYETSLKALRKALTLRPKYPEALSNIGIALAALGKTEEALRHLREAVRLKPNSAELHRNLGLAYQAYGLYDDALSALSRVTELDPGSLNPYYNMAGILAAKGLDDEAVAAFRAAVSAAPEDSNAHLALGMYLLSRGHMLEGWRAYEGRRKAKHYPNRPYAQPEWNGEPLAGKRLRLTNEQGLGDMIQFVRFANVVARDASAVSVEMYKPLIGLFSRSFPEVTFVPERSPLPEFDHHAPLMSVPQKLGLETVDPTPYLYRDPVARQRWASRLPAADFRIGIVWQGNPHGDVDRGRSIPVAHFAEIAAIDGVRLISMQKQFGLDQLDSLPDGVNIYVLPEDFDSGPDAFVDTIAVMENLDLVITSDTSVAHIAGGIGIEHWVMLKHACDWRWRNQGDRSYWYPGTRLFRQRQAGDWTHPFAEACAEVRSLVAHKQEAA